MMTEKLPGAGPVKRTYTILFLAVFLLSTGLRLALVRYNREANDNHMVVARSILGTDRLPTKQDCDECFQPKLYHLTIAFALRATGLADETPLYSSNYYRQVLVGELVNFLAGLATIAFGWRFIRKLLVKHNSLKLLAFALLALNPALIGINSQATNDTFAILFSTLALYSAYCFLMQPRIGAFLPTLLFTSLAISSKTNTLVTVIAIAIAFFIKAWVDREQRSTTVKYTLAFLIAIPAVAFLNPLNQWVTNLHKYGMPLTLSLDPEPFPNLFVESETRARPGILSIQDGFFTFKFVDLIKYPRLTNDHDDYPPHRTSFWTLLYARAHNVHYPDYPPTWSTEDDQGFTLSRLIFVFALLPSTLVMVGALIETFLVVKAIFRLDLADLQTRSFGLFSLVFWGYLGFVALYALLYRDFAFMKAIFLYPGLIAFPLFFVRAADRIYSGLSHKFRWSLPLLNGSMVFLLSLYTLDIGTLIAQIRALRS